MALERVGWHGINQSALVASGIHQNSCPGGARGRIIRRMSQQPPAAETRVRDPQEVPHGPVTRALALTRALLGALLAVFGFLLVLDRLSLRELLAETGPAPAQRLVLGIHATIEHPGAQVAELAACVLGVTFVLLSLRTLWRSTAQRRHSA